MISRRGLLVGLMAGTASAALGNPPLSSIRPLARAGDYQKRALKSAAQLIGEAALGGKVAVVVADAKTGQILEAHKPLLAQPPASVTKALTTLYALSALGPDHRFRTRLIATGPLKAGRIEGDLILTGGGDPTLDTDALGDMAAALKAAGVRAVAGKFLVHSGALPLIERIDPTQPEHLGYNPTVSGLNLNFNRVFFEWKREAEGYTTTMDARARRYSPSVSMAQMAIVERDLPVYTYATERDRDSWTVARRALGKGGGRWLPVRRPDLYAADVFQTLARAEGISLLRPEAISAAPVGEVIVDWQSGDPARVLGDMLRFSTNLTAEVVGMTASLARGARVPDLAASAGQMSGWLKATQSARRPDLVDHSGLGDASRITAQDMVSALVSARGGPLRSMLKPVAMHGPDGKLLNVATVNAVAKTGTLNFVNTLAGYLTAPDGRELAYAIFAADVPRRAALSEAEMEQAPGARDWNKRARALQQALLERWSVAYSA